MCIAVFTGGAAPPAETARQFFSGGVQTLIAADSGLETAQDFCRLYNLRMDLILGDMDSLSRPELLDCYPPSIIRRQDEAKDLTDTETALMEAHRLRTSRNTPIVLVGGDGGRTDHLFAIERLLGSELSPDFWLLSTQVCALVGEGFAGSLCVRGLRPHDLVSSFSVAGLPAYSLRSRGLVWPLDGLDWKGWGRSVSNWTEGEAFTLYGDAGVFYSLFPLREGVSVDLLL